MRFERPFMLAGLSLLAGCVISSPSAVPPPDKLPTTSKAEQNQEAARIHTELAQHYMETGDLQTALQKLQLALQFDADYVPAHTLIAVLYQTINDMPQAELHYRRAVALAPTEGGPNNNLGAFLCKVNRPAEGIPYLQKALQDPFYSTPDRAWTNEGICLQEQHNTTAAETDFRRAVDLNPHNADALYQLANVLYRTNDLLQARLLMQRLDALNQFTPAGLELGHDIELRLGDTVAATNYRSRLIEQFPNSEQARTLAIDAHP